MTDNVVKSSDINKSVPAKKTVSKKTQASALKIKDERNPNETVAAAPDGYKFILFESGASYTSVNGFKFTKENRIHLLKNEEADELLKLNNFRIPDQIELQEYAKGIK